MALTNKPEKDAPNPLGVFGEMYDMLVKGGENLMTAVTGALENYNIAGFKSGFTDTVRSIAGVSPQVDSYQDNNRAPQEESLVEGQARAALAGAVSSVEQTVTQLSASAKQALDMVMSNSAQLSAQHVEEGNAILGNVALQGMPKGAAVAQAAPSQQAGSSFSAPNLIS